MSDFVALEELTAADLNAHFDEDRDRLDDLESLSTVDDIQNTAGTTTSVTYTSTLTGGTACGIAFTAPPSGKVMIFNNCRIFNSGANYGLCTIRVRTGNVIGSGSDVLADSDSEGVWHHNVNDHRYGTSRLLEGLTPGATYNVQQRFKVTAGTGTFADKSLIVQKVL